MNNLKIDTIVAICTLMLVWCLIRSNSSKTHKNSQADPVSMDNYLQKITLVTGLSVYDTFCISAEDWHVSTDIIDQDFRRYL